MEIAATTKALLRTAVDRLRAPLTTTLSPFRALYRLLETDASDYGWGAVLMSSNLTRLAHTHQLFTPLEREMHITAKETLAALYAVKAFFSLIPPNAL